MTIRFGATVLMLVLAAPVLAGCGGSPPPPPPVLDLLVTASADINPNTDGAPRPVAVHLYQLAATQKFTNADVFALVEHEQATLGPDDLGSNEFVLKPSEKQEIKQPLKSGTMALGVVVWFHDIDNAQWRASASVAASGPTKLVLDVGKLAVSLKPAGK
jgi:type VI secretion system protein VasD